MLSKLSDRRRMAVFALIGALLLLIIAIVYSVAPAPQTIATSRDNVDLFFTADDTRFLSSAGCMTARWQVENINGVLLNDVGVTGSGERQLCGQPAHFRIIAPDDHEFEYRIEPNLILADRFVWTLVLPLLALVAMALWLLIDFPARYLIAFALMLLALYPRLPLPGTPLTTDETAAWVPRSQIFLDALQTGDLAATSVKYHPGVTTMWQGAVGRLLVEAVAGDAPLNYPTERMLMVLPAAVVNALIVGMAYLLLRRLFDPDETAAPLLASLLLATEPFLVAHGGILHIDSPLTGFMFLSLLTALIAFRLDDESLTLAGLPSRTVRWRWLAVSAALAALAMLARMTGVIMLPIVGLLAALACWRPGRGALPILPVLVWAAALWLVWAALFPAVWVDASLVYERFLSGVNDATTTDTVNWGQFFLGNPTADPGLIFYPVALAFRSTPWLLAGAGVGLVTAFSGRRDRKAHILLLIALALLIYLLFITFQGKKADRYMLPMFPGLIVLAAYGWVRLVSWWHGRERLTSRVTRALVWGGLTITLLLYIVSLFPYPLAYYNPALGGGQSARETILVGWGEGLEGAAAYVNEELIDCEGVTMSWYADTMERLLVCGDVRELSIEPNQLENVNTIIFYVNQVQREIEPELIALLDETEPAHVVTLNGVEYAWIYDVSGVSLTGE